MIIDTQEMGPWVLTWEIKYEEIMKERIVVV